MCVGTSTENPHPSFHTQLNVFYILINCRVNNCQFFHRNLRRHSFHFFISASSGTGRFLYLPILYIVDFFFRKSEGESRLSTAINHCRSKEIRSQAKKIYHVFNAHYIPEMYRVKPKPKIKGHLENIAVYACLCMPCIT